MEDLGRTDLGADLARCKECNSVSILMFSLCKDCRPDYSRIFEQHPPRKSK